MRHSVADLSIIHDVGIVLGAGLAGLLGGWRTSRKPAAPKEPERSPGERIAALEREVRALAAWRDELAREVAGVPSPSPLPKTPP
jgi:hypothetical protein